MEFFVAHHRGDRSRFEFQLSASPADQNTAALRHTGLALPTAVTVAAGSGGRVSG